MHMKGIILAAGEGTRLKPFTENMPKCLLPLEGKGLIDWQIEIMQSCGISDIVVIKGHMSDKITRSDVRYYLNSDFKTTNMVMTLWCASEELTGEVIIAYGDILYNASVLEQLIKSPHQISVVVDQDWQRYWSLRFDDPLKDAEALKMDSRGRIKIIGQKAKGLPDIEAGYIGLIKFKEEGTKIFKESFLNAQKVAEAGGLPWGVDKPFKKLYMTDMLQGLVNEGHEIYGVVVKGGWLEIDSFRDYELAKRIFIEGRVMELESSTRSR